MRSAGFRGRWREWIRTVGQCCGQCGQLAGGRGLLLNYRSQRRSTACTIVFKPIHVYDLIENAEILVTTTRSPLESKHCPVVSH